MVGCVVVAVTWTSAASLSRASGQLWLLHASTWSRAIATAGDCWSTGIGILLWGVRFLRLDTGPRANWAGGGRRGGVPRACRTLFNVSCTCTATGSSGSTEDAEDANAGDPARGLAGTRPLRATRLAPHLALPGCHQPLPEHAPSRYSPPRLEKPLDADLPEPTRLSEVAW